MSSGVSVLTLVRGRRQHLCNLLLGIRAQIVRPCEVVIAWMQDEPHPDLPDPGCTVRSVFVPGEPLPLARARNAAARAAESQHLVLLDVDCIPSATLCQNYDRALAHRDAVLMSEVFYLPPGVPIGPIDERHLNSVGVPHPSKPVFPLEGSVEEPDTGQLWGLSFGLRTSLWSSLGGMDERYVGYGGEETDFAARLSEAGVSLRRQANVRCWHQHHPVATPPLQHFDPIIANARRYRQRWGRWCMDYWLGQFERMGLIELGTEDIRILRRPSDREMAAANANSDARFS